MLPLDGVRVLAVEQYGAGPWGTQYLADIGAESFRGVDGHLAFFSLLRVMDTGLESESRAVRVIFSRPRSGFSS